MKKINWKNVVMIIFVAVSTLLGIYLMEWEFCEWMSGVMWMIGEVTIVVIISTKDFCKWIDGLYKQLAELCE
jgi:hypothetical protein